MEPSLKKLELLDTSRQRLAEVAETLCVYLRDSESVFLDTGARLDDVQKRVERLVHAAGAAANLAPRAGEPSPRDHLAGSLATLKAELAASDARLTRALAGMDQVLGGLDSLVELRGPFQEVAMTLWSLAVGLRIESAVLAQGSSFDTVAGDVSVLSQLIGKKFDAALRHGAAIRNVVVGAHGRAQTFAAQESERLSGNLLETAAHLATMGAIEATATGLAEHARSTSASLSEGLITVLIALQSHDITRQLVEHVTDALRHADESSAGVETETLLAEVSLLARLQSSQLRLGRNKLTQALGEISAELQRISKASLALAEETRGLADPRAGALLQSVQDGMRHAGLAFRAHQERELEAAGSMASVGQSISEASAVVREIQKVGHSVNLISLNAQVAAAKSGNEGSTLAVLARGIHDVSAGIQICMEPVSDALRRIRGGGEELGAKSNGYDVAAAFLAELDEVVATLNTSRESLGQQLVVLHEDSEALGLEIHRLVAELEAATEVTGSLAEQADALDALADATRDAAGDARPRDTLSFIAAAQRYTMEEERVIHRSILGQEPTCPDGAPSDADADLGDNIELF